MTTSTESALERQVREEQEAHDHAANPPGDVDFEHDPEPEPDEPIVEAGGQTAIVDRSQYEREDLQIPKIDGQTIDRIAVKFAGEIHLDRSDPADVQIYNALRLGKDVALLVEARCNSTGAKGATDRDGDLDVIVGTKGIKVHSLMKPAGTDWVTEASA